MNHRSTNLQSLVNNKLLPFLAITAAGTLFAIAGTVQAYTITFDNLPGPQFALYSGSSEGGFTITPTTGLWDQFPTFGNPAPSIRGNAAAGSEIEITGGTFTFDSFDYRDTIDPISYTVEGFLGGVSQYSFSGSLVSDINFHTLLSQDSLTVVDALRIQVNAFPNGTVHLDNIVVNATTSVPDSGGSVMLLSLGLAGLMLWRSFAAGRISAA